ncbi:Preprotein translocase subunit SecY [Shewanella sp. 0m-4]
MLYNQNHAVRFPKGKFAMWSVYSFTGASILASIIFSLLLFLSIDDDPVMQLLFGGLAVIFELGKFFAWYEVGERYSRKNFIGMFSALGFYAVLAAISIGGSIGGINSATNKAQEHVHVQQSKANAFNMQIDAIDKQIALNNVAAEKYIQMERIATGVMRIQKENNKLREQQQLLAIQRDSIPVVSQGSIVGLIESLAMSLNIKAETAQLGLVVFLSILLDFFAAFFVGLIGEENRFRQRFKQQSAQLEPITLDAYRRLHSDETGFIPLFEPKQLNEPEAKSTYEQVIDALGANRVNCSKRAVSQYLKISAEEVDDIFSKMFSEGIVTKKPNNHFQWQGVNPVLEPEAI